jgi:hypothetical protein
MKTNHEKLAKGRRLKRSSTVVGMVSGGTPSPRTSPAVTV